MSARDQALMRTDFVARGALLLAGLAAQAAMWVGSHGSFPAPSLIAAVMLVVVTVIAARRPLRVAARRRRAEVAAASGQARASALQLWFERRRVVAYQVLTCAVLVEACVWVVGAVHATDAAATLAPLGLLLLAVQLVQALAMESRRDAVCSCAVACAMLLHAGTSKVDAMSAAPVLLAGAVLISLLAMAFALALLHRGALLDRTEVLVGGVGSSANPLARAGAFAAYAAVIGLAVFALMPDSPQLGTQAHATLVGGPASGDRSAASGNSSEDRSQEIADPASGQLNLHVRGQLSSATVFATSADAPSYWRAQVFDTFDGTSWSSATLATQTPWLLQGVGNGGVMVQRAQGNGGQPSGAPSVRRTDTVNPVGGPLDVVLAPGNALIYAGPGRVSADAVGNTRIAGAGDSASTTYEVTSTMPAATPAALAAAVGNDSAGGQWTQLPAEVPARVRVLANQLAGTADSRYATVNVVEDYLRAHESYDLGSPVPAAGEDAVDDFVFVSHRGFCEQFATAAVVLLRADGIPTRLVTGYAQGDTTSEPGQRLMRGTDAHAWIQVWYPGIGWVDSDPTAGAQLAAGATTPGNASATAPGGAGAAGGQASNASTTAGAGGSSARGSLVRNFPGQRGGLLAVVGLALLLVIATTWFARRVRLARRGRRLGRWRRVLRACLGWRWARAAGRTAAGASGAGGATASQLHAAVARAHGAGRVLRAYALLDDALAELDRGRAPAETLREVAGRLDALLGAGQPVPGLEALDHALQILEQECYGTRPPAAIDVENAVGVFDGVRLWIQRGTGLGNGHRNENSIHQGTRAQRSKSFEEV